MSMPTFPNISPEITREKALTMILASIAMEELALSHIINAEGEKIQYVLKDLSEDIKCGASLEDVLAVNKSVESLLDVLMQSQVFLKSKMDKVLDIMSAGIGPTGPTGPTGATEAFILGKQTACKTAVCLNRVERGIDYEVFSCTAVLIGEF